MSNFEKTTIEIEPDIYHWFASKHGNADEAINHLLRHHLDPSNRPIKPTPENVAKLEENFRALQKKHHDLQTELFGLRAQINRLDVGFNAACVSTTFLPQGDDDDSPDHQ